MEPRASDRLQAARTSSSGIRSENTPTVRFSATLGAEPEVALALV
jgi:hypothetical protein